MAESVQVNAISHRHEAIADMFLAFPHLRKQDIAAKLGVSKEWLSIVINSDVFKEYWAARREGYNTLLREKLTGVQLQVALDTYNRLNQIVNDPECKPEIAISIAEHNLKALGYEPRKSARITETREVVERTVESDVLDRARERMKRRSITIEQDAPVESAP